MQHKKHQQKTLRRLLQTYDIKEETKKNHIKTHTFTYLLVTLTVNDIQSIKYHAKF